MIKTHIPYVVLLIFFPYAYALQKAVICVPVADLVGQPMGTLFPDQLIDNSYNSLPVCWKDNPLYACPRLHQLLYNDIVEIVAFEEKEVCINISQVFYTTPSSSLPQTTYWTHIKNVTLLSDIEHKNIDINHIPQPICFDTQKISSCNKNQPIITLKEPHYDPITRLTFSAGTRFISSQQPTKKQKKIKVFAIDYTNNKEIALLIPAHKCYLHISDSSEEQIKQFVFLLKTWAHQKNSFIPYVWGGTSFVYTFNQPFKEVCKNSTNKRYFYFEFDNDHTYTKSGLDCSGLVSRAAHICNIPYFCKNTTTIAQYLQPLTPTDTLINGDLIVIKGHVMIVSDISKNLLIEARSYGHGYGKVHEITLNKVFDAIETYKDLVEAFFNKKTLKRKDIKGNIKDSFDNWKIVKISSVF